MKRILIVLAILIATMGIIVSCDKSEPENQPITLYNSGGTAELTLRDSSGKAVKSLGGESAYSLLLRLDETDAACLDNLPVYERFYEIYKDYLNILFLWSNAAPSAINIPKENSFTIVSDAFFTGAKHAFALVDAENNVTLSGESFADMQKELVSVLEEYRDGIMRSANGYILKNLCVENDGKPFMIYLTLEGCADCESLEKAMSAEQEILDKYDKISIYTEKSTDAEFRDIGKVFQYAYNLKWFPSFVLTRTGGDYLFIGQMPEEEALMLMSEW